MYKLVSNPNGVIYIETNMFYQADPANSDYQQYLAWLALGNTPTPADEVTQ